MKKARKKILDMVRRLAQTYHNTISRMDLSEVENADVLHTINSNLLILTGLFDEKNGDEIKRRLKLVKEVSAPEIKITKDNPVNHMVASSSPASERKYARDGFTDNDPSGKGYLLFGCSGQEIFAINPDRGPIGKDFHGLIIREAVGIVGYQMRAIQEWIEANHAKSIIKASEPDRDYWINQFGLSQTLEVVPLQSKSTVQDWVASLTRMQQAVLLSSIRGPDGLHKNHVAKVLLRWFRRCILIGAFEGRAFDDPYEEGGGSFTGPCKYEGGVSAALKDYIRTLDEIPHHYQLHFMHAAEILGYKHPDPEKRNWWNRAYFDLAADMHLTPETCEEMDHRLGDSETQWREKEVVTAN